ncbi:MAG: anti-sigma factor [Actinomycetia bacterium]|nr:anti-sigma factor [Actinomycetes bacterium]
MSQSEIHAPDDLLALHAMGDSLPEAMGRHVAACRQCQSELDQWSDVIATARSTTPEDAPGSPSAEVWQAITAELGLASMSPEPSASVSAAQVAQVATVVSIDKGRRRWTTSWLVAASVAGIVGGAVLTAGGVALNGSDPAPGPIAAPASPVIASTALAALPKHQGGGEAKIVSTPNGKELVVDVSDLSTGEGFYEVWLIDPETLQMIGLGALSHDAGRFPIPDGLDLARYTIVDVSLEPFDGDPVHSRDSVVRGELST